MNNKIDCVPIMTREKLIGSEVKKRQSVRTCCTYTAAIQDDYEYWRSCSESDSSGKLFLIDYNGNNGKIGDDYSNNLKTNDIDDNDSKRNEVNHRIERENSVSNAHDKSEISFNNVTKKTIQIFFDDNIERDRLHIVDVRDLGTLIPVPFKNVNNVFVKKVEPYFAIIDDDYFINEALNMIDAQMKL